MCLNDTHSLQGEVVQHVNFPHHMRTAPHDLAPQHYVHPQLMYQQYLRAHQEVLSAHIPHYLPQGKQKFDSTCNIYRMVQVQKYIFCHYSLIFLNTVSTGYSCMLHSLHCLKNVLSPKWHKSHNRARPMRDGIFQGYKEIHKLKFSGHRACAIATDGRTGGEIGA